MEPPVQHPDHKDLTPIDAQRITAESMPHHLPGTPRVVPLLPQMQDVMVQLFSHHSTVEPILVPAVVEPLLVLVLAGMARVEERSLGGEWKAVKVQSSRDMSRLAVGAGCDTDLATKNLGEMAGAGVTHFQSNINNAAIGLAQ